MPESLNSNLKSDNIMLIDFKNQCRHYRQAMVALENVVEQNILSLDEVRMQKSIMTKKLQESVLKIHTSPITQGKGKDTRWFTTIMKGEKRIILKKATYEQLLDALVEFYGVGREKITLKTLYPEWIRKMLAQGASTAYIRRLDADWRKYYLPDQIVDKEISKLTVNTIKSWLMLQIRNYNLSSKKYYNMQTIFKQIFEYAYEEEMIEKNPFQKISIEKKKVFKGEESKTRRLETKTSQVFTEEDIAKVKKVAWQHYKENENDTSATAPLGILLLFQTGLRVGELVALRERNIFDDYIYVEEEEQRNYSIEIDESTHTVHCHYEGTIVGNAKTDASYRRIDLTPEAKQLIKLIKQTNKNNGFKTEDFLFVNATQRMQENTILKHIYKYCDQAFIDRRSPHKIRKTFASILVNSGMMDISEVAELMGHVNEKTLIDHYLYSTKDKKTRVERMSNVLQFNQYTVGNNWEQIAQQ